VRALLPTILSTVVGSQRTTKRGKEVTALLIHTNQPPTPQRWRSAVTHPEMLFLVPLAVVGYSAWKKKQQEEVEQQHRNSAGVPIESSSSASKDGTDVPTIGSASTSDSLETLSLGGSSSDEDDTAVGDEPRTADDLLEGSADDLTFADDEAMMALDDRVLCGSESAVDVNPPTKDETIDSSEPQGPFHGLLCFIQEQQKLFAENQDPWRIKSNQDSLTYEVLGHHGKCKTHDPRLYV
jgi:hypothetical protein